MSSASTAIGSIRIAPEPVTIKDIGREIVRWGLVVVLAWIGAIKFTACEGLSRDEIADAIRASAFDEKADAILKLGRSIIVQRGELARHRPRTRTRQWSDGLRNRGDRHQTLSSIYS
jgi:hypothetical protein